MTKLVYGEAQAPRYLSLKAVGEYLMIAPQTVEDLVRSGRLPRPIELAPRLERWDKEAIDAALALAAERNSVDIMVGKIAQEFATRASKRRRR